MGQFVPPAGQVPSAGTPPATTTPGSTAPSPSDGGAELSDDQLLGITPEGGEPTVEPSPAAGAEPGREAEAAQAGEEGAAPKVEPQPEEQPQGEIEPPEDIKALFKLENVGPKVRDLFFRQAAYQEVFPTVQEARQYREILPTLEAAQAAVSDQQDLEKWDDAYYSPDKGTLVNSLWKEDPEQFSGLVKALPGLYYNLDPQGYQRHLADPVVRDLLGNAYARAVAEGGERGENLKNAVDVIALRLFQKPWEQVEAGERLGSPQADYLQQREAELNQRQQGLEQQQLQGFYDSVNEVSISQVVDAIKATVEKATQGTNVTEGAKAKIVGEIYNQVDQSLKGNRELKAQLRREFRYGDKDDTHRGRIVQLLVGRAKQLIRPTAQKVLAGWTKDILNLNQQRLSKQQTAGARRDITGGGAPAGRVSTGQITPGQVDYGRTTDDDILGGNVAVKGR